MRASQQRARPTLRQLPASARTAAAKKAAGRTGQIARGQFSRTFSDVLSGRFGGRWDIEWEDSDRPSAGAEVGRPD